MSIREDITNTIQVLKKLRKFKNQKEVAEYLGYNPSYFSRTLNEEIPLDFEKKFFNVFPKSIYLSQYENLFSDEASSHTPIPDIKTDALEQLKKVTDKQNGKPKNAYEGREVNLSDLHSVKVIVIPISGQAGLQSSYYDEVLFRDLETEELLTDDRHSGKYFKIEVRGDSMNDGTSKGLEEGDWAYCRSVEKQFWRDKLYTHKWRIWCFFHNERGIIFKSIVSHNPETGEMELESLNPDKESYPNFKINIGECSYVCNVVKKLSPL